MAGGMVEENASRSDDAEAEPGPALFPERPPRLSQAITVFPQDSYSRAAFP